MPIDRHSRNTTDLPVVPLRSGERKQQWVYRQIVSAIEGGLLRPGDSIPSTRTLAARWGISRGVVELAFEQLNHEGYLHSMAEKEAKSMTRYPMDFLRSSLGNRSRQLDTGGRLRQRLQLRRRSPASIEESGYGESGCLLRQLQQVAVPRPSDR